MSNIRIYGSGYIKLTGNYGYNTSTVKDMAANTTIDATGATWIVANSANQHPDANTSYLVGDGIINCYAFIVYSAGAGLTLKGGTVWGQVPMTSDWVYTYNNSAAIRIENAVSVTIEDWRIDKVWDAIRVAPHAENFLITDVHLSNVRDDAIENDFKQTGTIRDTLIDGTLAGVSLVNSDHIDGSANTVTLENTFIRMQTYLQDGEMTHGSPFKTDTDAPGTCPDIRLVNCVIAIEDPTHNGIARLQLAWDNVVESHGNVFLNLSDTPLTSKYPMPPAGFTILQGQEARDYWAAVEAAWIENHDGINDVEVTPLPPLPGHEADPAPLPAPDPAPTPEPTWNSVLGTSGADTLFGTSGVDHILGNAGADLLYGKGGSDELTGGAGKDKFVFDTALDGSIDKVLDFNPLEDALYLDNAIFSKLGNGSLTSPAKIKGTWLEDGAAARPNDSNDYIIYDKNTGQLSYDADGNGAGHAVAFAQLPTGLDLVTANFFII